MAHLNGDQIEIICNKYGSTIQGGLLNLGLINTQDALIKIIGVLRRG
jgi:hypothetical protein